MSKEEEYDPWNEVPNEDRIKNCFSLSRMLLIALPIFSLLLYFLKAPIAQTGLMSEEMAQTVIGGMVILTVFLCISIIFTLGYLRRKLKQEEKNKNNPPIDDSGPAKK